MPHEVLVRLGTKGRTVWNNDSPAGDPPFVSEEV